MEPLTLLLLLSSFCICSFSQPIEPTSMITVEGVVYCDICSINNFSRHSYFLPGVDVHIQCKFKANSPKTTEQMAFSANRTTDKHGVYTLEIPSFDGVDCVEGQPIEFLCQASSIRSSSSACNVTGLKTTTNSITVKSKQEGLCIYCLDALSFRPLNRNITLCGNQDEASSSSLKASNTFLPKQFGGGFTWSPIPPSGGGGGFT